MAPIVSDARKKFSFGVDLKRTLPIRPFEVVDGDTGNRFMISITDDGDQIALTGRKIVAVFSSSKGVAVQDEESGVSISDGRVMIDLSTDSFAPGMVECELEIWSASSGLPIGHAYDVLITTARFNFVCRSAMRTRSAVLSDQNER